ncbi:hypothetical protein [Mycoplasma simbae]|uniref:hypothetical protein n=1 Tax=Mycoplasma simbae TaxID=36744 RepID=UPI0004959910|nr:hypothetical protein [Mycoplasma simbae]
MASIERDPIIAAERIQKRRELLIQLHEENKQLLSNPALVKLDKMSEKECEHEECLLNHNKIDLREYKKRKISKILSISISIGIIVVALLTALIIGRLGQ